MIFVAVAFFIPAADRGSQQEAAYNTTPLDALFALRNTVMDLGSFCERNPATCQTGKSFFGSLGIKARDGARMTYEFLDAKFGSDTHAPATQQNSRQTGRSILSSPQGGNPAQHKPAASQKPPAS